jgi:hypothetical protein
MRRITVLSLSLLVIMAGLLLPHVSAARASHVASVAAKKKCTIKKVHGKKKRVCKSVRSTPTAVPANIVRTTPAFPGAPPGGFIAGVSTTVAAPVTSQSSRALQPHQTGQPLFGGSPIIPIDFTTDPAGPLFPGGSLISDDLTITVADGRGFTVDQTVCFRDWAGKRIDDILSPPLCAKIKSVAPALGSSNPRAVVLRFYPVWGGPTLPKLIRRIGIVQCNEIAVPVASSTSLIPGQIISFPLQTPGGIMPYSGQVAQTDPQNHLLYLPVSTYLANYNPLTPGWAPNQLLPPGTLLKLGSVEPAPTITIAPNAMKADIRWSDSWPLDTSEVQFTWTWFLDTTGTPAYRALVSDHPDWVVSSSASSGTSVKAPNATTDLKAFSIEWPPGSSPPSIHLVGDITTIDLLDGSGHPLLSTEATVQTVNQCLIAHVVVRAVDPCATPEPVPTPTATSLPLFRYSFSGLGLSWKWQSPPSMSNQDIPSGTIVGTACGSDPMTAAWSGTVTYYAGFPVGWTANFAASNPAVISQPYDESPGTVVGTMTVSLQLVPGTSPHMQLLAVGTGDATNINVNPSDVAIQATPVSSCA